MDCPTEHQVDILRHLARGLTIGQVATKMFLSSNTIKTHLYLMYKKLDVANRSECLAVAYENDWWGYQPPEVLRLRDGAMTRTKID